MTNPHIQSLRNASQEAIGAEFGEQDQQTIQEIINSECEGFSTSFKEQMFRTILMIGKEIGERKQFWTNEIQLFVRYNCIRQRFSQSPYLWFPSKYQVDGNYKDRPLTSDGYVFEFFDLPEQERKQIWEYFLSTILSEPGKVISQLPPAAIPDPLVPPPPPAPAPAPTPAPPSATGSRVDTLTMGIYKRSLQICDQAIAADTVTALKDLVGREYENHRQRIFSAAGFDTRSQLVQAGISWTADGAYYKNGQLVALEETKGHYADKCMSGRALREFMETIYEFDKAQLPQPRYIFHVFGPPTSIQSELDFWEKMRPDLKAILTDKLTITYVCPRSRNPRDQWFTASDRNGGWYSINADDSLIAQDVQYINDLFHSS